MIEENGDAAPKSLCGSLAEGKIEARRHFLKGGMALASGSILLSIGALDKLFRFFFGPRLSQSEEGALLARRLKRMEETVALKKLELERQHNDYIFVADLSDLQETTGMYFVDYQMSPALAFVGRQGLPILLSAKCTHLGCTVGNEVNKQNQVLCPCHVSYFNIETGEPNPGAPAKLPLSHIGWVLMDKSRNVIASRGANGKATGNLSGKYPQGTGVYITKTLESISS
jgi:Rieske Fe-S protein